MGTLIYNNLSFLYPPPRPRVKVFSLTRILSSSEVGVSKRRVLEQVDEELSKGDERTALSLVKDLQGKPGGLRCFGAARQVRFFVLNIFLIAKEIIKLASM